MFGTVDTDKGWHSQVYPRTIGGITTCHKMRHNMSLPTVTYFCMRELPNCHHDPTSPSQQIESKLIQVDQGSSVPLAKCSFGMIPLSRYSVYRSPRAFHPSTHNAVRAYCFEVFSALLSQESCFWMEACAWQGVDLASDLFTVRLDDEGQIFLVICLQFTLSKKGQTKHFDEKHFFQIVYKCIKCFFIFYFISY